MKKNKGGRPTKMTPDTLAKLKEGFLMGLSDDQACLHADINPVTLYRYCDGNEEFCKQKELWKKNLGYRAVKVLNQAVDEGDVSTAKFVAERRLKDEWSSRTEQTGKDGKDLAVDIIIRDNIQPKGEKD
jgi:hypothetical protein